MNEDTNIYEIGFHLLPTVEEDRVSKIVDEIKKNITENGGSILSEESPKMTSLTYSISKAIETSRSSFDKAYFGWLKFSILPENISKIYSWSKDKPEILRFLIVKTDRENSIHFHKIAAARKEEREAEEVIEKSEEVKQVKEEEIDKSIEDLVIT